MKINHSKNGIIRLIYIELEPTEYNTLPLDDRSSSRFSDSSAGFLCEGLRRSAMLYLRNEAKNTTSISTSLKTIPFFRKRKMMNMLKDDIYLEFPVSFGTDFIRPKYPLMSFLEISLSDDSKVRSASTNLTFSFLKRSPYLS